MNRPKAFRYLRIAWSVTWGLLGVLVCLLWVRSYWWADIVEAPSPLYTGVMSAHGSLRVVWKTGLVPTPSAGWSTSTISAGQVGRAQTRILGFTYKPNRTGFVVQLPDWFLVLSLGALATLPWLPWRFSLRTLLIAMTVFAVGLGMAAYLFRG